MRTFESGATRDDDEDKLDFEGFLSPLALERYAQYLHAHRKQADGKMRDSDQWQQGLPIKECVKSMIRHVIDIWKLNRCYMVTDQKTGNYISMEEALCANIFNSFSILHELEKEKVPQSLIVDPRFLEQSSVVDQEYTRLSYPGSTCAPSTSPSQQPTLGSVPNTPLGPAPTQYGGDE